MSTLLFASLLGIMVASLSGAIFASRFLGGWLAPRLRYLVALAAGVFVVIIYNLSEEVLHEGLTPEAVGAFVLGAVLLDLMTRLLPKNTHHHHGPHPEHPHAPIDARRMLAGDAVHNIHDGLTLVPAFLVSPVVGLGTAAGILLHEIVQEIAEFFVLREAGYSVRKALTWNFAVSATILIGAGLALTLTSVESLTIPLIAFSAGGFTYIVLRDLLPSVVAHAKAEQKWHQYGAAFVIGLCIMIAISFVAPHGHEEEDEYLVPDGFGIAMK